MEGGGVQGAHVMCGGGEGRETLSVQVGVCRAEG